MKKPIQSKAKTIVCLECDGMGVDELGKKCKECNGKGIIKVTLRETKG
jgi:DnaJ-class molecular chaperone